MDIIQVIDDFQGCVFDYRIADANKAFLELVGYLETFSVHIPEEIKPHYNQVLIYMLNAFENKDYLLLADIVEFELKHIHKQVLGG